jgi:hypothetical protein
MSLEHSPSRGNSSLAHSYTIPEWCELERVSRAQYYRLKAAGKGPKTHNVGEKAPRISHDAAKAWRALMEEATV